MLDDSLSIDAGYFQSADEIELDLGSFPPDACLLEERPGISPDSPPRDASNSGSN